MRLFPPWHSADEVATTLLRGLKDGSIVLESEPSSAPPREPKTRGTRRPPMARLAQAVVALLLLALLVRNISLDDALGASLSAGAFILQALLGWGMSRRLDDPTST